MIFCLFGVRSRNFRAQVEPCIIGFVDIVFRLVKLFVSWCAKASRPIFIWFAFQKVFTPEIEAWWSSFWNLHLLWNWLLLVGPHTFGRELSTCFAGADVKINTERCVDKQISKTTTVVNILTRVLVASRHHHYLSKYFLSSNM